MQFAAITLFSCMYLCLDAAEQQACTESRDIGKKENANANADHRAATHYLTAWPASKQVPSLDPPAPTAPRLGASNRLKPVCRHATCSRQDKAQRSL